MASSAQVIARLQRLKFAPGVVANDDHNCPICMESYVPDAELLKLPCKSALRARILLIS
jgi:hypothetical protein